MNVSTRIHKLEDMHKNIFLNTTKRQYFFGNPGHTNQLNGKHTSTVVLERLRDLTDEAHNSIKHVESIKDMMTAFSDDITKLRQTVENLTKKEELRKIEDRKSQKLIKKLQNQVDTLIKDTVKS